MYCFYINNTTKGKTSLMLNKLLLLLLHYYRLVITLSNIMIQNKYNIVIFDTIEEVMEINCK